MQEEISEPYIDPDFPTRESRKQWLLSVCMGVVAGMMLGAAIMYQIMQ